MKVPALTFENFSFSRYIIDLTSEEFDEAKDAVVAMWYGVFELWEPLPGEIRLKKRELVLKYLIMWYLADLYPTRLTGGVMGSGGMPLNGKAQREEKKRQKQQTRRQRQVETLPTAEAEIATTDEE